HSPRPDGPGEPEGRAGARRPSRGRAGGVRQGLPAAGTLAPGAREGRGEGPGTTPAGARPATGLPPRTAPTTPRHANGRLPGGIIPDCGDRLVRAAPRPARPARSDWPPSAAIGDGPQGGWQAGRLEIASPQPPRDASSCVTGPCLPTPANLAGWQAASS